MEILSGQDIGVEIGLAQGGRSEAGEAQAETAYQYHPQSWRTRQEMHGGSAHRTKDDPKGFS